MFHKILIANRGEIACRVIKTTRALGIPTVAVYSEADKGALHVNLADEAIAIGPAPSAESYLAIPRIIDACRTSGADAVHPGYGFLSENAKFAERIADANIAFIGPSVDAIRSMGDKITSKKLADSAQVNTIPGHTGVVQNADHAVQIAQSLGYPVMIKASAGGGGKGMRIARDDTGCRKAFERAEHEAQSVFDDGRLFIEKYIERPRHIEIQVLADKHGNVIHLGERECSLQRRHQKVIEEAPSPLLDQASRAAMGDQAVALARAVDYESAGTVEFIVDSHGDFYFLEMNTRLQVEHPVTECVTGLDLVEWMIRIAAGQPLPITQDQVRLHGCSIEARVYAEDPLRNFLPSVGRLIHFIPPVESDSVRVDTGIDEGGEVSMYYDPMIAKLITYGPTRQHAIARMREALNQFCIRGVSHNLRFLAALIQHPRFRDAQLSTELIDELFPGGFEADHVVHAAPCLLVAIAASIHQKYAERAASIAGQMAGYERIAADQWVVVMNERHYRVQIHRRDDGYRVTCEGQEFAICSKWQCGQPVYHAIVNGDAVCLQVERHRMAYRLLHWGAEVDVMVLDARAAELLKRMPIRRAADQSKFLLSPMPGLLTQLNVQMGSEVKRGEDLVVIEAMKMENVLRSDRDSKIVKVLANAGDTLVVDQPILEFE